MACLLRVENAGSLLALHAKLWFILAARARRTWQWKMRIWVWAFKDAPRADHALSKRVTSATGFCAYSVMPHFVPSAQHLMTAHLDWGKQTTVHMNLLAAIILSLRKVNLQFIHWGGPHNINRMQKVNLPHLQCEQFCGPWLLRMSSMTDIHLS